MGTFNSTGSGGDWELTATWAESGYPVAGDTVTITAGDTVTLTQNEAFGTCIVEGTLAVGSHTLAGSGSGDGNFYGGGEVTLTTGTITTSAQDYKPDKTTITGNATITANQKLGGEFDIQGSAAPTITARGAQGGLNISADGNSTVNFIQSETGVLENAGTFYNLNISGSHTMTQNNAVTVANDLAIASGTTVTTSGSNYALTVTGDVTVTGILTGNASAISMRSLTIADGGEYSATSGTTTITGGKSSTNHSFQNLGTFTHNKGKIKVAFTPTGNWYSQCNEYYDLELAYTENWNLYLTDQSGGAITVLGDLTITHGMLEVYTDADSFTVHGLTTNKGTFENAANQDTNKITHHGLVTNTGTYRINTGTTVKMNGGIRQLGTLLVG
jgi:hypothetical protein